MDIDKESEQHKQWLLDARKADLERIVKIMIRLTLAKHQDFKKIKLLF